MTDLEVKVHSVAISAIEAIYYKKLNWAYVQKKSIFESSAPQDVI